MTYADAIKKLRNKILLMQTEFCKSLGVKFGTVNRWETEKFEPTMRLKRKLSPMFEEYDIMVEE